MGLSTYFNNIIGSKFAGIFRTGRYGNTANATLLTVNNLIEQINLSKAATTVVYKYETGVTSMGVTYKILKAINIDNGYTPGSNPANKENNPCDACTNCVNGAWTWSGKPCWVTVSGGTRGTGCVDCASAIADLSDGTVGGVPSIAGRFVPLVGTPNAVDSSPGSIVLQVTHVPPKITVGIVEDPNNAATGANNWHFVFWNTETNATDYSHIADARFIVTYYPVQNFVSPQGPH